MCVHAREAGEQVVHARERRGERRQGKNQCLQNPAMFRVYGVCVCVLGCVGDVNMHPDASRVRGPPILHCNASIATGGKGGREERPSAPAVFRHARPQDGGAVMRARASARDDEH